MRVAVIAVVSLLTVGCSTQSQPESSYALPVHEVYSRLLKADMNGFKVARQCGLLIHFKQSSVIDHQVSWQVTSSGRPIVTFTVTLIPAGPDLTRTKIEVSPDPRGGEMYDGDTFYPHPAIHQPLRPAVKELVDAAVQLRPYDVWKIPEPINTNDDVCSVQRGAIEGLGTPFHIDDKPGDYPGASQRRNSAPRSAAEDNSSSSGGQSPAEAGWGESKTD